MNIETVVVRKNGVIDTRASLTAFKSELENLIAEERAENRVIEDAAHAVFDAAPGKAIPLPAVLASITTALGATPANFTELSEHARRWLYANAEGDRSTFIIAKGKGGGVRRRSDIPVTH